MSSSEVEEFQRLLEELYVVHDTYFEADRKDKISVSVKHILSGLQAFPTPNDARTKALLLFIRGKTLDALPEYSKEAEEALSKATKLDPYSSDCWNCLGHVFWKKGDLESARKCFEGALQSCGPNKISLRQLSMVLRTIQADGETRQQNAKEALVKAKESVKLDVTDAMSWYILGNAHLCNFFVNEKTFSELVRALKAYQQAENCTGSSLNPDLFFNRGTVYAFLENFQLAVEDYEKAHQIDPSLGADQKADKIVNFIAKTSLTISTKGRLKQNRLSSLLKSLPSTLPPSFGREMAFLSELNIGSNAGKVLVVKSVLPIPREGDIPVCFVVADGRANFLSLSIYNVDLGVYERLRESETLFILDPTLKVTSLRYKEKHWSFLSLRVVDPSKIVIDGQPLQPSIVSSNFVSETFAS